MTIYGRARKTENCQSVQSLVAFTEFTESFSAAVTDCTKQRYRYFPQPLLKIFYTAISKRRCWFIINITNGIPTLITLAELTAHKYRKYKRIYSSILSDKQNLIYFHNNQALSWWKALKGNNWNLFRLWQIMFSRLPWPAASHYLFSFFL